MFTQRQGFTLVEIMIVVTLIGILAMISFPAIVRAMDRSRATAIANDFRLYGGAFEMYAGEYGHYPGEMQGPAFMPPGVGINAFLDKDKFMNPAPIEGEYDWDGAPSHPYSGISVRPNQVTPEIIQMVDDILDDGDLNTGCVRNMYGGGRIAYVLQ